MPGVADTAIQQLSDHLTCDFNSPLGRDLVCALDCRVCKCLTEHSRAPTHAHGKPHA